MINIAMRETSMIFLCGRIKSKLVNYIVFQPLVRVDIDDVLIL